MRPFDSFLFPSVIAQVPDDGFAWGINNNNYTINMFGGGTFHNYGAYTIGNNQIVVQGQTGEWASTPYVTANFCGNTFYTITMDYSYTITGNKVQVTIQRPVLRRIGFIRSGSAYRNMNWNIFLNGQSYLSYNVNNGTTQLTPNAVIPSTTVQTFTLDRGQFKDINLAHFINTPNHDFSWPWRDEWNVTMRITNSNGNQPGVNNNTPFITHKDVHLRKGTLFGGVNSWGSGQQGWFDIYWGLTPATMTNHIRIPTSGTQSSPSIPDTILRDLIPRTDYWYYATATNQIGYSVRTPNQMFKTWHNPGAIWDGLSWRSLNNKRCHIFTGEDGTPAATADPAKWIEMGTFDGPPKSEKGWYGPPEQTTPEIPTIYTGSKWRNRKYYEDVPSLATPVVDITIAGSKATISWDGIPEADSYEIIVTGPNAYSYSSTTTNTTLILTGLAIGDYQVLVRAKNSVTSSEFADESFTIIPGALGDPEDLLLSSTPYELTANWNPAENADYYTVTITDGTTNIIQDTTDTIFQYQYASDNFGAEWTVSIQAKQFSGAESNIIEDSIVAPLPLPAPLSAVINGGGAAEIASISAVAGAISYRVQFFDEANGVIVTVDVADLDDLPQDVGLEDGIYTPTVFAVDQYGAVGLGLTLNNIEVKQAGFEIIALEAGNMIIHNRWTSDIIVNGVNVPSDTDITLPVNIDDSIVVNESTKDTTFHNFVSSTLPFVRGVRCSIVQMLPTIRFTTKTNPTNAGSYFFQSFNQGGTITSLPAGSFDTSSITNAPVNFFYNFNREGALTSLPDGSFDTSNITTTGAYFLYCFAYASALTSLPAGSFDTSNIITAGTYFLYGFNFNGKLTSLPAGSFDISSITTAGNYFINYFNNGGALTSLPAGSFNFSSMTTTPATFFQSFNQDGALTSLPAGSFDTSNITTAGNYCFNSFNQNGKLTSLPAGSFNTSNITTAGNYFFQSFNQGGALTSLPAGSFDTSGITIATTNFFYAFNYSGALTSLPAGSFNTNYITTTSLYYFYNFNRSGKLTSLPAGSFNSSSITTAGNFYFSNFNYGGALTSLPAGSFNTSGLTNVGTNFFENFNFNGRLTIGNSAVMITAVAAIPAFSNTTYSDLPTSLTVGQIAYINGS